MKKFALIGFLGGILFAIGDLLVYLIPHYSSEGYYTDVANMNMWRLAGSAYLGCIGNVLLLIGLYSLYKTVKSSCSEKIQWLFLIIAFGITLTPIGHFVIACLGPMTYKCALSAGATIQVAKDTVKGFAAYTDPIRYICMIIDIVLQSVMMVILVSKKKINCPKWMAVLNPLGFTLLLSIPLIFILKNTSYVGIAECFESLGEGAMYLTVYCHQKRTEKVTE